jgi:hypothetical protein
MTIHFILSPTAGTGACYSNLNAFQPNGTQDASQVTCKRCLKMLETGSAVANPTYDQLGATYDANEEEISKLYNQIETLRLANNAISDEMRALRPRRR